MKNLIHIGVAVLIASLCSLAIAGPAHWFQWRSKLDGKLVCSQTPLGPGWEKAIGPFSDSHCAKRIAGK